MKEEIEREKRVSLSAPVAQRTGSCKHSSHFPLHSRRRGGEEHKKKIIEMGLITPWERDVPLRVRLDETKKTFPFLWRLSIASVPP